MPEKLSELFYAHKGPAIDKWVHYFAAYELFLAPIRWQRVRLVEFGIGQGGSLQMWSDYFPNAELVLGIDILPSRKQLENDRIQVEVGDQADRLFLHRIAEKHGPFDIVIDDGGHHFSQQIATFEELFPFIREPGLYITEDMHTSYWERFGGAKSGVGTFIEYVKKLIDDIHWWHYELPNHCDKPPFLETLDAIHVYDSLAIIEKRQREKPRKKNVGHRVFAKGE